MVSLSEKTSLVPEGTISKRHHDHDTSNAMVQEGVGPAKQRLRKLHSAPLETFLSTGMDMDSLRLSYAAKLVLTAVEGRSVESAVDMLIVKGGFVNPLAYPLYRTFLVCVVMGHLVLALWEGGKSPFPLSPAVALYEVFASMCYTAHILLNLWTFGFKQYRDKKWHFTFSVLAVLHFLFLAFAASLALWQRRRDGPGNCAGSDEPDCGWWNTPRLVLLAAHALRPMILISKLETIRRVFTNVLRTASRTGSTLVLGMVTIAFFSVLGINLFNSRQVKGYSAEGDNFDNFGSALLSLFVLTTEENFPMVADPSFSQRPLVAFPFFVSFLLVFLVVIQPLLLAIVLDAYAQQHAEQHARYRRKARNALLAAYYVLDEDGAMGLSKEQLMGVLTTKAGVGIDQGQAEQIWQTLAPEGDEDTGYYSNGKHIRYTRSHSVPLQSNASWVEHQGTTSSQSPRSREGGTEPDAPNRGNTSETPATVKEARAARLRYRCPSRAEGGVGGRVDVHGFLRLTDLLHQRVVESLEDEEQSEALVLAGYGDAEPGVRGGGGDKDASGHREGGRRSDDSFCWEIDSDGATHDPFCSGREEGAGVGANGSDSEQGSVTVCIDVGGVGGRGGGSGGAGVAGPQAQGWRRCSAALAEMVKGAARRIVGRMWFSSVSQVITVLLTVTALVWTPEAQKKYDRCLRREERPDNNVVCWRIEALKTAEGLLLFAFFAEMAAKVLAVGCKGLWRRHWAHGFDFVILGVSIVAYIIAGIPGNTLTLYVDGRPGLSDILELPRAIRVLRLFTVFPQLRRLLETMSSVAAMLLKIMVLYWCVSYFFAVIGMAIFGDATSDILDPRYSFTTLPKAFMSLFFLTVTNNWNDLLYPLVNSVRMGRWSALYFVTYILFCATMMLDVLVGVVIEGFRVSTRGPQQEATPGSDGAISSGNSVVDDDDASLSDSSGISPVVFPVSSGSTRRPPLPPRELSRKVSQRKYKQVRAQDMFRSNPKENLSREDARELEDAVKAVEGRLHQAWVNHVQSLRIYEDCP